MKKLLNSNKLKIAIVVIILFAVVSTMVLIKVSTPKEGAVETFSYSNVAEQILADEVIVYLQNAAGLGDGISAKTGNEAVETYRSIVRSDVDMVNDNHTQAIQKRIGSALKEYAAEEDEKLSTEDISSLSAGVAELVWQSILSQIEIVTESVEESEYFYLAESLQQQIQELEERKMKVSIRANIKNNTDLTSDDLLAMINGMTDKELEELAKSMGLSMEELQKLLEAYRSDSENELDSRLKEKLKELEKELIKELAGSEENGKDGEKGEAGADGKAGKDGSTGRSVFIRYSENANGLPMTERPTATTKYIGTYSGTKASTNSSDYSWSKYTGDDGNSVFIRYAENANGKGMSKTPNSNTKYMGTYVGATESNNPDDYIWTRYSDATISYSNGTLYITQ